MEIRNLINQGINKSEIARLFGLDRKTVQKHADAEEFQSYEKESKIRCKIDPYRNYIKKRIEEFPMLSIKRLYREILAQGYPGKETMVRDFVNEIRDEKHYLAVKRFETLPGQQAQIDWGSAGTIFIGGKEFDLSFFSMVLGFSRMRYTEFTITMETPTFIQCHVNGFKYFGGAPKEGLYDNLKQVVIKRRFPMDKSDFTPQYMDFAGYYGLKPILCRPRKPRTKGKVENSVGYIKRDFLLGTEFTSLEDINSKARAWCDRVNSEIHSSTKEIPFERLKTERALLTDISNKPDYKISEVFYRKAGVDCLVPFDASFYSVPPSYAGKEVSIKKEESKLEIFYRGECVAEHTLLQKGDISFLQAHKEELEKHCFYVPKLRGQRRPGAVQIEITDIEVEQRNLEVYER